MNWVGEIPAHWEVKRLKYFLQKQVSPERREKLLAAEEVSFLPMEAIGESGELDLSSIKNKSDVGDGYTLIFDGDVVVAKITPCFENGKGALIEGLKNGVGFGTTELHILTPAPCLDARFLCYLTQSETFRLKGEGSMIGAAGQKRVPESFISNFIVALPPLQEQQEIVSYLNQRVIQIDELRAEKEKFLTLLDEKRAALIAQAVTRGLILDKAFKPSGFEWLGDVPEHWEVARLKFCVSKINSGKTPLGGADVYVKTGVPLIRSQNVHFSGLQLKDVVFIEEEVERSMANSRVQENDVLLNITGASIGRCCVVPSGFGTANVNQHVCIIRCQKWILTGFLKLLLQSRVGQSQIFTSENGVSREGLTFEQIGNFVFGFPPLPEQCAIVAYLEAELARLDGLASSLRDSIDLLRERRAALISASVAGHTLRFQTA